MRGCRRLQRGDRVHDRVRFGVRGAGAARAVLSQRGVGALGVGEGVFGEAGEVVRAQDADLLPGEGQVGQRLMLHARGVLGDGPGRPGRLRNDGHPAAQVANDEVVHDAGNDPSGVAAVVGHVAEPNPFGIGAERDADQVAPGSRQFHQDRLVSGKRGADLADDPGYELRVAAIEHRLVHQPGVDLVSLVGVAHGSPRSPET